MSRIILVKVNVKWARVHPFVQSVGWSIVLYYIEKIWLWIWANRLFLKQRQNKCQRRTPHTRSQKNVSIWSEYSVALSSISSSICYYLFNPADSACFFLFLSIFFYTVRFASNSFFKYLLPHLFVCLFDEHLICINGMFDKVHTHRHT